MNWDSNRKFVFIKGGAVARRMLELGMSTQDLADRIPVSIKTVQRWVNGQIKRVTPETLKKMAESLQVAAEVISITDLLSESGPTNRILRQLLSEPVHFLFAQNDHERMYLELLLEFDEACLPDEQKILYLLKMGALYFRLGMKRKGSEVLAQLQSWPPELLKPEHLSLVHQLKIRELICIGDFYGASGLLEQGPAVCLDKVLLMLIQGQWDRAEADLKFFLTLNPQVRRHARSLTLLFYLHICRGNREAAATVRACVGTNHLISMSARDRNLFFYCSYLSKILWHHEQMDFSLDPETDCPILLRHLFLRHLQENDIAKAHQILRTRLRKWREHRIVWAHTVADWVLLSKISKGQVYVNSETQIKAINCLKTAGCIERAQKLEALRSQGTFDEGKWIAGFIV